MRRLAVALAASLAACTPRACDHADRRALASEVEFLVAGDGPVAAEAERRLIARGESAIAVLETGLYSADAAGRRRVIRVLAAIGAPETAPILEHLAGRDPDPTVRAAAAEALARLGRSGPEGAGPP